MHGSDLHHYFYDLPCQLFQPDQEVLFAKRAKTTTIRSVWIIDLPKSFSKTNQKNK
jgi:hypothetical protein